MAEGRKIEAEVKRIIKEQLDVDEKDIKPESTFIDDLGADSLGLVELGASHVLEVGPGEVLSRLSKRIAKALPVLSVGDLAAIRKVAEFLEWPSTEAQSGFPATSSVTP